MRVRLLARIVLAMAVAGLLATPLAASAADTVIEIPIDTILFNTQPTPDPLIDPVAVTEDLQGLTCDVSATSLNQESVNPGNNLVITSGGDSVTLFDVEREEHVETIIGGELTLGPTIVVTLERPEGNSFSAGLTVEVSCRTEPEPTPTPTPTPSPEVTVLPTATERPTPTETPTPAPTPTDRTEVLASTGGDSAALAALGLLLLGAGAETLRRARRV